eukprot:4977308-Prymnesium_polylepis.1
MMDDVHDEQVVLSACAAAAGAKEDEFHVVLREQWRKLLLQPDAVGAEARLSTAVSEGCGEHHVLLSHRDGSGKGAGGKLCAWSAVNEAPPCACAGHILHIDPSNLALVEAIDDDTLWHIWTGVACRAACRAAVL